MTEQATTPEMQNFGKVCEIMAKYEHRPEKLITILQEVQAEYRYLPKSILAFVAMGLKLSPAEVYGVATFYAHFTLEPQGKFVIKLCDGTACHVKQSIPILEAIRERLKLSETKPTTDDMLFTVETVSCLGACGLAPVMLINEDVHGQVTPQQAIELIEEIITDEANGAKND
ncbi:MAG: NAD(P)H-dependent oxidoreductase subunit E [Phycisphaerae bacterium]|nr:NAD(P)H-dependent oxidoreductase subunit E [Phycisphaerae bacterium]